MTNSRILLGFILTMVLTGAARPARFRRRAFFRCKEKP